MATKEEILLWEKACKKWEDVAYNDGWEMGADNCAWCGVYLDGDCEGCPIYSHTGYKFCGNTPYEAWEDYFANHYAEWNAFCIDDQKNRKIKDDENGCKVFDGQSRKLAVKMLYFIKDLRPK